MKRRAMGSSSGLPPDVEKNRERQPSIAPDRAALGRFPSNLEAREGHEHNHGHSRDHDHDSVNTAPFIGRLGANGAGAISRCGENESVLKDIPDAAPWMSLQDQFDLRPFMAWDLWKSAITEGMGSVMLVWITIYAAASPNILPDAPTERFGIFDNAAFVGPLVSALLNFIVLTLFTFSLGAVSGAHLNPTISIATFLARLSSFPRTVLYIGFQTGGAAIGGALARVSYGTRDFKVGGCFMFTDYVPAGQAFVTELMATFVLLFFAFGVGLDPRQRAVVGPTLGPFLVGLALASVSLGTGYSRYGYGGASCNPARCFGAFVGSQFPSYHWIHWIGDIAAAILHAMLYHLVPPWKTKVD